MATALHGMPKSAFSGSPRVGHSIRERKRNDSSTIYRSPDHLYLIYISLNAGQLIVRHAEADIDPNNINAAENGLISVIGGIHPTPNFGKAIFDKPSFFTIVLDVAGWDFYYPNRNVTHPSPNYFHNPITFLEKKVVLEEEEARPGTWREKTYLGEKNHSFYDLELVDKAINGQPRKAIRCINYVINANGRRIASGDPYEDYIFNIYATIPFYGSSERITLVIDPDGQNQGPP